MLPPTSTPLAKYFPRKPELASNNMSLKDSSASEPFRRLSKNDLYQTTDQWKERTFQKIGDTSGTWVAYAKQGDAPKVPTRAPYPPVKPSSPATMQALKAKIRPRRFLEGSELNETAQRVEGTNVEDLPLPDDYEAWEEYERLKAEYQREARDYERLEKMALETFPNENRKVFSSLIDCISDASVQDLKRSTEGGRLFQECDALGFFNLAIKEHEYLTPTISAAAVARSKDEFENLRQKSEDSIIEHINEFRRRLDVYLKARGTGAASPYADFDLKYLLIRSLYQPAWSGWVEYREANDNMPATFEELINALKKAEATKILRSTSPVDPMMHTAHVTTAGNRSSSPAMPTPCKCSVCGLPFCPAKPQFTRCDKCQEAHVKARKKERKKTKDSKKKPKGKQPDKKVHATFMGDEDSGDDSEDEEAEPEKGEERNVSFSCICSTQTNSPIEELIY